MTTKVLLLFGGESSEHDVSLVSAANVYAALDKTKYDIELCYITKTGEWWYVERIDQRESDVMLTPLMGQKRFGLSDGSHIAVDVMLPVLHGTHGEDGDVQAIARLIHVPCVGPSLIGAAITLDKDITKQLAQNAGVPVVEWITWHASQPTPAYESVRAVLGDVVFVKPANAGSSVGVSKVVDETSFVTALGVAREHDDFILIERAIAGREIELAVLGNENPRVTHPGEIIPGEEFYSYDDKYGEDSASQARIPAELPADMIEKLQDYAVRAYTATRGQGMARIDFFVDENQNIYLNEINSIPGFTNISMYPKLWQNEGVNYPELLDELITLARTV